MTVHPTERVVSGILLSPMDAASPDAQWCVRAYFDELGARLPGGFEPGDCGTAAPEEFAWPNGLFLVARLGGRPVGCGGVRTLVPGVGEIRRMWVEQGLRGGGVGRRLLERVEVEAARLGVTTLRLYTSEFLQEAVRLYLGSGYTPIAPYNDNEQASLWLEKQLDQPGRGPRGKGPE